MNFCAIVGCSNRADKHKGIGFYRLPAVISHQGEQTCGLTCKRRDLWLSRIHRDDLGSSKYPYVRVCSRHFISGKLNQWRIQDFKKGGSNILLRAKRARIFRSHAHFWTKPRPLSIVFETVYQLFQSNRSVFEPISSKAF